jgi:hypothetical protein
MAVALVFLLAQVVAFAHQFDHPVTGADSACPFCIGGHGLDQVAIPKATDPALPGATNSTFDPGILLRHAAVVRSAHPTSTDRPPIG